MRRREFLGSLLLPISFPALGKENYAAVKPGHKFSFPRDHGAHPGSRTEWWYITGWLAGPAGFQVTFSRVRPEADPRNPSAFNPRQVLLAQAALAEPKRGRLVHDERAARAGFSLAEAEESRTGVWIDDWRLEQEGNRYNARILGKELDFDLSFSAKNTVLQGEAGFSRKGHRPPEASYYYSRPQLGVAGKVNGKDVGGTAWLDHEWSSAYLAPEAAGWDWCGINLFDGGSLMAFLMRGKYGGIRYTDPAASFEVI